MTQSNKTRLVKWGMGVGIVLIALAASWFALNRSNTRPPVSNHMPLPKKNSSNELGIPIADHLVTTFQKSSLKYFGILACESSEEPSATPNTSLCIDRNDLKSGESLAILGTDSVCYGSAGVSRTIHSPDRPKPIEGLELGEHNCHSLPSGSIGIATDQVGMYLPLKTKEIFTPDIVLKLLNFLKNQEPSFETLFPTQFVMSAELPPKIKFIQVADKGVFSAEVKMNDKGEGQSLVDRVFLIGNGSFYESSLNSRKCTSTTLIRSFVLDNILTLQLYSCACETDSCGFEFVEAG